MRAEKQSINSEYVARLNSSPFFIVADYRGLKVRHFNELRKRLKSTGAEFHVVKNSIFRIAAKEAGVADLNGALTGQLAVVTGKRDISAAAKVVKTFGTELDRLKIHFGFLNNQRLEQAELIALADLPSLGRPTPGMLISCAQKWNTRRMAKQPLQNPDCSNLLASY